MLCPETFTAACRIETFACLLVMQTKWSGKDIGRKKEGLQENFFFASTYERCSFQCLQTGFVMFINVHLLSNCPLSYIFVLVCYFFLLHFSHNKIAPCAMIRALLNGFVT